MRPMDTKLKTRMAPSLGLLTVAQTVRKGNEVLILNENVDDCINYDQPTDIVGITVTVDTLPRAIEIGREFRKRGVPWLPGHTDYFLSGIGEGIFRRAVHRFRRGYMASNNR